LRRLAEQCGRARADRAAAEAWARNLDPARPLRGLPENPSNAYAVGLLHALRDHPASAALLGPLSEWAARHGLTPAEAPRQAHRPQAADQVSIGNCVTTLRLVNALDWAACFERASLVEADLREEPARVYPRQDFATRDAYRRAVERLARGSAVPERA